MVIYNIGHCMMRYNLLYCMVIYKKVYFTVIHNIVLYVIWMAPSTSGLTHILTSLRKNRAATWST